MNDENKLRKKKCVAIFLRGGSGVGKSTLADALVKVIPFSAKIEVDELRYMISGGLVGSISNVKPFDDPDEYLRQCRLADKNAFALARNFLDAGFIPIIDGLNGGESSETYYFMNKTKEIRWYPHPNIFLREIPGIKVIQIVLDTPPNVLIERLKLKGNDKKIIDFILSQREIFFKAVSEDSVDYITDTSKNSPEIIAEQIIKEINLQKYF